MSTITTIASGDLISNSRTDINTNFANLNSDKIETSTLDTDTTLAANSDSKIATQKAVKAYVDTGGNVNASTTTKGIVEQATSAEVLSRASTGGTGAPLFINPSDIGQFVKFGGTGEDGALTVNSGTTTIDLGSAQTVVKNYTTISITGTGKVAFSNPHANGTTIIFKSQGNVTLTSSQAPMIDASGMGAASDQDGYSHSILKTNKGGMGGFWNVPGVGGSVANLNTQYFTPSVLTGRYIQFVPGSGGGLVDGGGGAGIPGSGGGASVMTAGVTGNNGTNSGSSSTSNFNGGRGGAALIIECAGAFNFTTASGISVAGLIGTSSSGTNKGGAGGGGGGSIGIFYNTLTANSGTITVSGGSGGTGSSGGGTGGAGGAGFSLVAQNTVF